VPQAPVKAAIEVMPPRPDSKLAFYKNGYHLLMRDKAGPAVTQDVVAWISDHEAMLPSGRGRLAIPARNGEPLGIEAQRSGERYVPQRMTTDAGPRTVLMSPRVGMFSIFSVT
jgi:hypothetical protein